ncbi:MAG: hypothetical protein SAK29_13065 [Scytonema sp. PMC 1069.18]|nr:hypothetical protein [Scytonema sp. PMC 1069.18]MEC4880948.1 hypothetical protein [Scytonema sp. PMC 1070.18]
MELAQTILTEILSILIYGFSTLFIWQFTLELSIAFQKHCDRNPQALNTTVATKTITESTTNPVRETTPETIIETIVEQISETATTETSKPPTIKQLRRRCSQAGIKWSYAIQKPELGKKRHLNREEMLTALTHIQQSA